MVGVGGKDSGGSQAQRSEPRKPSSSSRSRSRSASRGPPPPQHRSHSRTERGARRGAGDDNAGAGRYPSAPRSARPPSTATAQRNAAPPPPMGLMSPAVRKPKRSGRGGIRGNSINPFPSVEVDAGPLALRDASPARSASTKRGGSGRAGGSTGSIEAAPEKKPRMEQDSIGGEWQSTASGSIPPRQAEQQAKRGVRRPSPAPSSRATEVVLAQHELDELIEERLQKARAEWLAATSESAAAPTAANTKSVEEVLSASASFASLNKSSSAEDPSTVMARERADAYKSEAFESRVALRSAEQSIDALRRELDELRFFHELENDDDGGRGTLEMTAGKSSEGGKINGVADGGVKNASAGNDSRVGDKAESSLREEIYSLRAANAELEGEASSLRATVEMCEMASAASDEDAVRIGALESDLQNAREDTKRAKEKIAEVERELHEKVDEANDEKSRVEAQLKDARVRAGDMAGNFAVKVERVGALERTIEEMRAETEATVEEERGKHEGEVRALRDELGAVQSDRAAERAREEEKAAERLRGLHGELEAARTETEDLRDQLQGLRDASSTKDDGVAEKHRLALLAKDEVLTGMRSRWKEEENKLRRDLAQAKTDLEAIQHFSESTVNDLRERLEEAEAKRAEAEAAAAKHEVVDTKAEAINAEAKAEAERLISRVTELESALHEEESRRAKDAANSRALVEDAAERLRREEAARERSDAALVEAMDRLARMESDLARVENERCAGIKTLDAEVRSVRAELAAKESALAANEAKVAMLESELEETRADLAKIEATSEAHLHELEKRYERLDHDRSKKAANANEFEKLLSQSKSRVIELENDIETTKARSSEFEVERQDLTVALKEAEDESEALTSRVVKLDRSVDELREANGELKRRAREALDEAGAHRAEIVEVETELLAKAKEERARMESEHELEVGALRTNLGEIRKERDTLKTGVQLVRAQLDDARHDIAAQGRAGEARLEDLQGHLKSAENRIADLEFDLSRKDAERSRLLRTIEAKSADQTSEIKSIATERDSAVAESKSLEATIQMYDIQIEKTEEDTKTLESRLRAAEDQRAAAERRLRDASSDRTTLERELGQAESELSSKIDEADDLLLQIQEREEELKNAKLIAASALTKIDDLNTAIEEQRGPSARAERELRRKDSEAQTLRASAARITERMDRAEARNGELELDLGHAMSRCDELEKSLKTKGIRNGGKQPLINAEDRRAGINATVGGEEQNCSDQQDRRRLESDALQRYMSQRFENGEI